MSLEQLAVVSAPQITFDSRYPDRVTVEFTPTVPHCGMSTFIGKFVLRTSHVFAVVALTFDNPRAVHPCAPAPKSPTAVQDRYPRQAWLPPERTRAWVS